MRPGSGSVVHNPRQGPINSSIILDYEEIINGICEIPRPLCAMTE